MKKNKTLNNMSLQICDFEKKIEKRRRKRDRNYAEREEES